jgi:hypothetical protein
MVSSVNVGSKRKQKRIVFAAAVWYFKELQYEDTALKKQYTYLLTG